MSRAPRFYVISDRRRMGEDPVSAVLRLAEAGIPAFQWREKDLPVEESCLVLGDLAHLLSRATDPCRLFVNDRVDMALALGIDVHLPESGLPTRVARRILGPDARIGRSTHSLEAAQQAREEGADFVTFGPVYDTPSKRAYGPPLGLDALERAARALPDFPVLALGGVTLARTRECLDAGAWGVAVIGAVWDAPDPVAAARSFLAALPPSPGP